ncbi:uncharacterized protein LOC141885237 isoform X4 [Acropora palmata]|uniref:uncharacterized protein LOC141885237 isoform X4 n=1 Tax=Acropora palmata TaxID=6131 RepID=UPI003DA1618F
MEKRLVVMAFLSFLQEGAAQDDLAVIVQNATDTPSIYESWCNDDPACESYTEASCHQDWLKVNCPQKCRICGNGTASRMTTPSELNKSKPYTELSVTVPSEVTKSLEMSRKPVVVNIKGEKGKLALSDKPENKAPMVETIVVQLPGKIKTEDENKAQLNVTGPGKTHLKASVKHGTTVLEIPEAPWCNDKNECSRYSRNQCNDAWVQLNCPRKCQFCRPICKDNPECSRYSVESCENDWMKVNCKKKCGLCEGLEQRGRDGLPGACAAKDHESCYGYPMHACEEDWLIKNCKRKCGLCQAPTEATVGLVAPTSSPSYANKTLIVHLPDKANCYYDGILHEHGERWSPGPCTPECKCDDGKIHCTLIECPELSCHNPIKKRWKCCPECPAEEGLNARCIETDGGTSNGACCVFPFIYHGVQYFECTEDQNKKPWCATTSNYDIDGMWGHCLEAASSEEQQSNSEAETASGRPVSNEHEPSAPMATPMPSTFAAPVTGVYSDWSHWSQCSASCGGGTQERTRKCFFSKEAQGGVDCSSLGPSLETRECNALLCPEDGGYTPWSDWSDCDVTCGGGIMQRYRSCTNPSPSNGGRDCSAKGLGSTIESKSCNLISCPHDGGYTDWTGWSQCDKSCGDGKKYRSRSCTNPLPTHGGHDCSWFGSDKEVSACNDGPCEVDGGFTGWTDWSACSRSCGPGVTSRHRTCSNPRPSAGGKDCSNLGSAFEQRSCLLTECPASGNWTNWSDWTQCTRSCGSGLQFRKRVCVHPKGNRFCLGEKEQSRLCNSHHCPVNGNYTDWSKWTSCSTTCGVGVRTRNRTCTSPMPQFRGRSCEEQGLGLPSEAEHCYLRQCGVNGNYTEWSDWSTCSHSCGPGFMVRSRTCTNPSPSSGGFDCTRLGKPVQSTQCYLVDCPIDGNYTAWSNWTTCSATCGEGTKTRTRSCTNPSPLHGGRDCTELGSNIEIKPCKEQNCLVNGDYGEWSSWSSCSKTCGRGWKKRIRACNDPMPSNGGKDCYEQGLGSSEERAHCFERSCPLDGSYNDWSAWTTCSMSCGGGVKFRHRNCTNPAPMHGGRDCSLIGPSTESDSCNSEPCPVNGMYGTWSLWSDCDRSCGGGARVRSRSCTNPPPQFGGSDCSLLGPVQETQICNMMGCPVNGNYSEWTLWAPCSVTCGQGIMTRKRFCTNPSPTVGGKDCADLGPDHEKTSCQLVDCRANCSCGMWTKWSDCSHTCGGGIQLRERDCVAPKYMKDMFCDNDKKESRLCRSEPCPINGKFGLWSPWSPCSVTCGIGVKNRTRMCNAPEPQFGGKSCTEQALGSSMESTQCYLTPCPVNGGYTEWNNWSPCSVSCGKGIKTRQRFCTNPDPAYGGVGCGHLGSAEETLECYDVNCPIDGMYSPWSQWSACSKSCGYGIQTRKRTCTSPEPQHGGRDCTDLGDPENMRPCQVIQCPIHGNYSTWSRWGTCSASCGPGVRKRTRACNNPAPEYGGLTCKEKDLGPNVESSKCDLGDCPVNGVWGPWSLWSACTASCGPGTRERKRSCNSPAPKYGGEPCSGAERQVGDCSYRPCPVDGNYTEWTDWTVCDKTCGTGLMTRWRACSNPTPQYGGRDCSLFGPDMETKTCVMKDYCPSDGNWGEWSSWSACTKSCGFGVRMRVRSCDSPSPSGDGRDCVGENTQTVNCKAGDCCNIPLRPLGCFQDRKTTTRPLPELIFTDNDPESNVYSGITLQQDDWEQYMPELVCRCATAASLKNYTHFGIQGYGECWSGPAAGKTYLLDGVENRFSQRPSPKPWLGCVGDGFERCRGGSDKCVGQENTNFVYAVVNLSPIDGKYGRWSDWTPCSKSCGTGMRSRIRNCTSPAPAFGGKDCSASGDPQESEPCEMQSLCPVDGGWSAWGNWTTCSKSCGQGVQERQRFCNSPAPSNGGQLCLGPAHQTLSCNQGDCPVNGSWSAWSSWQACSATCGDGLQVRSRVCENPRPTNGGYSCEGDATEVKPCTVRRCPINGNYSDWSDWSTCSRSCSGGIKTRKRECINPSPRYGGRDCKEIGSATEKVHCNPDPCPVHGNWNSWSMWSFCSVTCGPGKRERMRKCDNPPPKFGGESCFGSDRQTMPCSLSDCPVDGRWGKWSPWTECSATCGAAKRSRTRECDHPPSAHGGKTCEGPEQQEEYCDLEPCMVNGDYTQWRSWTECDVTCGGGHRQRSRACTSPVPEFGGLNCTHLGPTVQSDVCNTRPCAQPGGWSGWSVWSACSRSCGSGSTTRRRTCTAPPPSYGGVDCSGDSEERKACKLQDCCEIPYKALGCFRDNHNLYRPLPSQIFSDSQETIDFKEWPNYLSDAICRCARESQRKGWNTFGLQNYGECLSGDRASDTYFDEGEQLLFMSPTQPKPLLGCVDNEMKQCSGNNLECAGQDNSNYVYSLSDVKAVQGNYTEWSDWSDCSTSCGPGEKFRTRNCTNPPPAFGGMDCSFIGMDRDVQKCEKRPCAVDGNWADWGNWSACSATCGHGTVHRTRTCDNPEPANGGRPCAGEGHEIAECHMTPCPLNGDWSGWNAWSPCSVTCGNGRQERTRKCNDPVPEYGGKFCEGPAREFHNCEEDDCPGFWSDWSAWSACSKTCGVGGRRDRTRTCQGGATCVGSAQEIEVCKVQDCPVCHKSVDLAFILDASGTIDDSQWKLTKDFVQGVSNGFRLASNGTRISIVTYSTLPHIERRFDDLNRNDNLIGFLESMSQPRGDTRTDRALKAVRDQLIISEAGARDFTPKAIVIVTDGGDKHDTTARFAEQRARELKDMDGATIVALGVGNKVDQYELRQLASDPDHAFLVASYDDIIGYVKSAADAVCTAKPPPPPPRWGPWTAWSPCMKTCGTGVSLRSRECLTGANCRGPGTETRKCKIQDCPSCQIATDLAFVLPVSSKINDTEWREVQNFVKGVANAFNISYEGTHVGVLSYSAQATMEMKFNRYFYASDVLNAIDNIYPEARSYQGTRMDDAMEIANYELFTPTGGSRDQISKVMIVLVSDPVADAKSRVLLRRLKYSGVSPVAVGVGTNVKNDDLLKIADSKHTFSVGSYNDLITVAAKVVKSACEIPRYLRKLLDDTKKQHLQRQQASRRKQLEKYPYTASYTGETVLPNAQQSVNGYAQAPEETTSPVYIVSPPVEQISVAPQSTQTASEVLQSGYSNEALTQQHAQEPVKPVEPIAQAPSAQQAIYTNPAVSQQPVQAVSNESSVFLNASQPQQPVQQSVQSAQLAYSNAPQPVYSEPFSGQQVWANVTSSQQPASPVPVAQRPVYSNTTVAPQLPLVGYGNESVLVVGYPNAPISQPPKGSFSNTSAQQPAVPQSQAASLNITAAGVLAPQQNQSAIVSAIGGAAISQAQNYAPTPTWAGTASQAPVVSQATNQTAVPQTPNPAAAPSPVQAVVQPNASVQAAQTPPEHVLPQAANQTTSFQAPVANPAPAQVAATTETNASVQSAPEEPTFPAVIAAAASSVPSLNKTAGQAVPIGVIPPTAPASSQVTAAANQPLPSSQNGTQGVQGPATAFQSPSDAQPFVCPQAMDLVFALDSSSDVAANEWTQQKDFMKKVAHGFQVKETGTHAGVVAYSTIPSINMKLGERNEREEVDKAFDDLPRDPGNRNLVILLEMAKFEVFTKSSGMRTHLPKALIVSVLGPQNDHNTNAAKSLRSFAKQLEISGVKVIAVGSSSIPESDLQAMTTEAKYAVRVNDFQSPNEADKVAKIICNVASEYPSTGVNQMAAAKPIQVPFSAPVHSAQPPSQTSLQAPSATLHGNPVHDRNEYPFICQPVLYYDFDKICAGEIFDESGLGNNGMSRGRVVVEAGYNGDNGLDLSDGFIQLDGLNFKGKPTLAVTIAAWVKAKNVTGPNVNEIFMTEAPGIADPNKQGQYHFEILDKGRVRFFQRNMDKTVYGRTTREGIPGNTWVHLAGVYNPASKQALIYINGRPIMDYEQTDAQETDSLGTDWSKAAYIGTFTDDQGPPRQFKGALDEFYIFPCALSGIQIAKLKDTHKMPKLSGPYPGVQREVWRGVQGNTITDLALYKDYPKHPTETTIVQDFDTPKNEGDNYGSRVKGYFVAPYTGTYSFSLSGNDEAELFFSGSSLEKDKDLFAVVHGTGHNDFNDQPYQQSGYIPLEAGKYYWIEALHKEGTRRDSLSVGFTLECPNAPSVLSEKPILRPSLQYNIPRSCLEVKKMWPGFKDDEYVIQITPSCNPVRLYCHGMNTATPREYITLQSGPERNFASFHRGRLLNFESCAGSVNPEPKLTANYWGTTRFNKIRLDPATGLVQRDDFQFSKTEGNPVRYGRAGDCYSAASKCHKGKFFIDLTGTGLRMRKEVEWEAWGTPKLPKRLVNVRKSQDGLTAIGECGGSCGGCEPIQEKMLVEPSTCTDASTTEAVSRQAIPIPPRTKKDEKGEKKSIVKIPQKIHVRSNLPYPHAKKVFQGPGSDESEMEVIGHVTKKKRRSESKKKRKRNLTEGKTADQ